MMGSDAIKSLFVAVGRYRLAAQALLVAAVLLLGGCASGPNANPQDPLEPFNRSVYRFNDEVDKAVVKPVANAYVKVVPSPLRSAVRNFFNNLQDLWSFVNNVLQLKAEGAGNSIVRFGVNTVFGLGGLIDIASDMRIERHREDFGQTLGYWGMGSGPYLVLPFLGPSTLRDTAALPVEMQADFLPQVIVDPRLRRGARVVQMIDTRSRFLDASKTLEEASLDPYAFTRDAFLQLRRNMVYDGNPPAQAPEPVSSLDEGQPLTAPADVSNP